MSQVRTSQYPDTRDSVLGTSYPVDLGSAAALMEWFYRIKTWRHTVALTENGNPVAGNGTYDYNARATYVDNVNTVAGPANERYTVQSLLESGTSGLAADVTFSGVGGFTMLMLRTYFLTVVADVQTEWYPGIEFQASNPAFLVSNQTFAAAWVPAAATLTIAGNSVPLYEIDPFPAGLVWGGSYDITPIEWWPSAPTLGGPDVFDTATGAQINPNVVSLAP